MDALVLLLVVVGFLLFVSENHELIVIQQTVSFFLLVSSCLDYIIHLVQTLVYCYGLFFEQSPTVKETFGMSVIVIYN